MIDDVRVSYMLFKPDCEPIEILWMVIKGYDLTIYKRENTLINFVANGILAGIKISSDMNARIYEYGEKPDGTVIEGDWWSIKIKYELLNEEYNG